MYFLRRTSFEIPKRDQEKEVERKARARRAREERRSTQGVSKEDLEEASQRMSTVDSVDGPSSDSDRDSRTGGKVDQPAPPATMATSRTADNVKVKVKVIAICCKLQFHVLLTAMFPGIVLYKPNNKYIKITADH